jgi:ubiquinol-cytochrome c reductase cytochrome c subunit
MADRHAVAGWLALGLVAVASVTVLRLAGGAAASGAAPTGGAVVADAAARGAELYQQSCASCHGPMGAGTSNGPPVRDSGTAAWDFYLRTGRMPLSAPGQPSDRQRPAFGEADIAALVAFGATLGTGPTIPSTVTGQGDPALGLRLYTNSCAACHGATAAGGSVGPDVIAPPLVGKDPRIVAEAIAIGPGPMPRFSMSPEEMSAIGSYLGYLAREPDPGGIRPSGLGPVPEGLIAVVVGLGVLVLVARWIGDRAHPVDARGESDDQVDGDVRA